MSKNNYIQFALIVFLLSIFSTTIFAQDEDTVKNYWMDQVEIRAKRINLGEYSNEITKDRLNNILDNNGFSLIRKGVYFAQDIYADGFKRGDINIVVDGERYHSACPNRMDSPLIRVNPLELSSVELIKNGCNVQSGLAGVVQFKRSIPEEEMKVRANISGSTGAMDGMDLAVSGDMNNHRISFRYAEGNPYKDADGNTFADSYGYKDNFKYKLAEVLFRGNQKDISYGMSFTYTDNVSFPYLRMDERLNWVYSAFTRYKNHKIYFNYTHHIMDNALRVSPMFMETDAKNLTIGAIGDFYEIVFRNWDADNVFRSPKFDFTNQLIPNVNSYLVNLFKTFQLSDILVHSKLGMSYQSVGETERETFYQAVHQDAGTSRFFPIFSLGASYTKNISKNFGAGVMLEVNSEAPETETMFIAVKKPMGKPAWSGNPTLDQPIKSTLRGSLNYSNFVLELYGTQVWNYVNLTKVISNGNKFLTYDNIDAVMFGANLNGKYEFVEIDASYIWAKNNTNDSPLAEIPPLRIATKLVSPEFSGFRVQLKHTYNDAQLRIDDFLTERATSSWNRFDIGINYTWNNFGVTLDVDNVTNAQYYQHLSFLRDPFASGKNIFEPGRVFRVTFKTSSLF
ncbi:MAG: hypothetical protein V3V16_00325 [Melioribacteraceae bacterium]